MPAEEKLRDTETEVTDDGRSGLSLGAIEGSLGFVLRIAQLTAFERFFALLGDNSELKISEFTVLLAIAENPGVRQGVIADVLKIKWSSMTKLVRVLEKRELIGRHIPPHDRRSVELHVTDKGRAELELLIALMDDVDRKAFAMLSDSEHAQLLKLVRKVAGWPALAQGSDE